MTLVERVYAATSKFPSEERFGLTAQIRRAAVSIPSNIAEGRGRGSDAELVRFCSIAYGSLMELETQIELAQRLHFLDASSTSALTELTGEVGRMLNALRSALAEDRRPATGDR